MLTADQMNASPRRTALGTLWRCLATLAICLAAIAAGAWLGSKLIGYDGRLATGATAPPALGIGALTLVWLRARIGYVLAPLLGTLLAGLGGAVLLHDGAFTGGHPHLAASGLTRYELILAAAGLLAALLGLVCAAVGGHRHPRTEDEPPVPSAEKG